MPVSAIPGILYGVAAKPVFGVNMARMAVFMAARSGVKIYC
jgi:hypothetical protein